MPKLGYYARGDHNAQCDQCGLGFKFSVLKIRWDNAWVCPQCWEPRQPQDFVRAVKDDSSVKVARSRIYTSGVSNLASAITSSSSTIPLATGSGAVFPATSGNHLLIEVQDTTDMSLSEQMWVQHSASSDSLTSAIRGKNGTTARAFSQGALVTYILTTVN